MPTDDLTLLREFAATQSETAFATLVQRHVNLVYSAARRRTGDDHLAEEITQAVFILLARKAGTIGAQTLLTGWLYRTTHYAVADALKQQRRRLQREHQAYMEATLTPNETDDAWKQISPVLDGAMDTLNERDRNAVLLRYFENKPLAEVGAALGVSEDAARVRVNRALEKLRATLTKSGVTLGVTAIAGAVTANAIQAAPLALATSITAATLTGTSLTLATIAMTTLQKIAVTAALTVTIGAGIYEAKQASDARDTISQLQAEQSPLTNNLATLRAENEKLSQAVAEANNQKKLTQSQFNELMKLRGQTGQAQTAVQELAKAQAALKNQKPVLSGFLTNAMAMGLKTSLGFQKKSAAAKIARMKETLHLTDDQVQAIKDITFKHLDQQSELMLQAMTTGGFKPDISGNNVSLEATGSGVNVNTEENEIKAQLTPDQLAEYSAFNQAEKVANEEILAKYEAEKLAQELSLTADQQQQMHDLIVQDNLNKSKASIASLSDAKAAARNAGDYPAMMNLAVQQQQQQLTNSLNLFQSVLTPTQLQQYQESEQQRIDMMKSAFSMFVPPTNSAPAQ